MKIRVGFFDWPRGKSSKAESCVQMQHTLAFCPTNGPDQSTRPFCWALIIYWKWILDMKFCIKEKYFDVGRKHGRWSIGPRIIMNLPSTPSLKLLPPSPRSPSLPSSLFSFSASPDPLSQYCSHSISPCLHFLLQTASWGTRVYFATCGDGSLPRPELAASGCWFLTCVHSFTSTVAHSSLLPSKTLKDPLPREP